VGICALVDVRRGPEQDRGRRISVPHIAVSNTRQDRYPCRVALDVKRKCLVGSKPPIEPTLQQLDQGRPVRSRGPAMPSAPKPPQPAPPPIFSLLPGTDTTTFYSGFDFLSSDQIFRDDSYCTSRVVERITGERARNTPGFVSGTSTQPPPSIDAPRIPHNLLRLRQRALLAFGYVHNSSITYAAVRKYFGWQQTQKSDRKSQEYNLVLQRLLPHPAQHSSLRISSGRVKFIRLQNFVARNEPQPSSRWRRRVNLPHCRFFTTQFSHQIPSQP
jgi:hypothetical protein